ncbi:hypothetical protein [Bartonella apis]|uniref:hypothetical protein n=1 Tax=Bartonella apis TaxID=1686310 RepID=UPI00242BEC66|nr:hypothetical protein [Bartonella apis]
MSRKAAKYTEKDIERAGKWAMKNNLKALIIKVSPDAKIIIPLDKNFDVESMLPEDEPLDDNFTL